MSFKEKKGSISVIKKLKQLKSVKNITSSTRVSQRMVDFQFFSDDFAELCERYDDENSTAIIVEERNRLKSRGRFSPFIIIQGFNKDGKLPQEFYDELIYDKTEKSDLEKIITFMQNSQF